MLDLRPAHHKNLEFRPKKKKNLKTAPNLPEPNRNPRINPEPNQNARTNLEPHLEPESDHTKWLLFQRPGGNGLESEHMNLPARITNVSRAISIVLATSLTLGTLAACNTDSGPAKIGEIKVYPKIAGGDHTKTQTETVTYDRLPPIGGKHAGIWQNCGIYDTEIRNEPAVHALEHGAVWFTYKPETSESDKIKLRQLVAANKYTLMSPFPTQDAKIVLSAWGVQLKLNELDDAKIQTFMDKYMFDPAKPNGKEPQNLAEFGAQCVSGTGQPRQ